jgi:hypothetical protein
MERIAAAPTKKVETRFGTIEYADQGTGVPLRSAMACWVATSTG